MKPKFEDNEIQLYINIGIFFRRFSDFEMVMLILVGHLSSVSANKIVLLQADASFSSKLKALKMAAESAKISDAQKKEITTIANKFGTNISTYRNKIAHGNYHLNAEKNKLVISEFSQALWKNNPDNKNINLEKQLSKKTRQCTELGARLLKIYTELTGQKIP